MSTEQQSLPPDLQELREMISQALEIPPPDTYEGRVESLETHLRQVTARFEGTANAESLSPQPDKVAMFARVVGEDIRKRKTTDEKLSDCDNAMYVGLAAITLGALAAGPAGALAGFGFGVLGLVANC
jgi:hypothetical protein